MRLVLAGLILVSVAGAWMPAWAGSSVCAGRDGVSANCPVELAAQTKRPRVTIYPRRVYPGPNAKRQCRAWLAQEYRVSGPVIVPQMRCWWE
jgi:hypothetical protein